MSFITANRGADALAPGIFRALLDKASDAIHVMDPRSRRFIYANEASQQMHGFSLDEMRSMSAADIDPFIQPLQLRRINASLRKHRAVMFDSLHRRRDGSSFPVQVQLSLVRIDGRDWRLAVVRDLTERRKAEIDARMFRALLDRASDAIEVIDPDTLRYLDVNETACRILGYSRDEMLSMSVWDVDTEMEGMDVPGLLRELQGGRPLTLETTHRRKDGSTFPVEVVISQVHLDRAYNIVVARDITDRKQHAEILRRSLEQSILAIADTVEARDPYTAGHQRRVGELATAMAREMALPEEQVQGLHLAALIHDLGKIHVPAEILSKPGRLSDAEYQMIREHPKAGYDILKHVAFPWPIADIVLQHHERSDGSGYPQGLKGERILREARILAVADVVESMISHRPYRPGLGIEVALAEIEVHRGGRYDAQAVDACLRLFRQKGYVIAKG